MSQLKLNYSFQSSLSFNQDLCCQEKTSKEFGLWALSLPDLPFCHCRFQTPASMCLQSHSTSPASTEPPFQQHHVSSLLQSIGCSKVRGPGRPHLVFLPASVKTLMLQPSGSLRSLMVSRCLTAFLIPQTLFLAFLIITGHITCVRVRCNEIKSLDSKLTFRAVCQET